MAQKIGDNQHFHYRIFRDHDPKAPRNISAVQFGFRVNGQDSFWQYITRDVGDTTCWGYWPPYQPATRKKVMRGYRGEGR